MYVLRFLEQNQATEGWQSRTIEGTYRVHKEQSCLLSLKSAMDLDFRKDKIAYHGYDI